MDINYSRRNDKEDAEGRAPIYLDIYVNGKRTRVFTGQRCFKKYKSNTLQKLNEITKKLEFLEFEARVKGGTLTKIMIEEAVKEVKSGVVFKEKKDETAWWDYYDLWMEEQSTKISKVTRKVMSAGILERYRVLKNKLILFEKETGFKVESETITEKFYIKYRAWVIGKKKQAPNTFMDNIKTLRTFCGWLQRRDNKLPNDFRFFEIIWAYDKPISLREDEVLLLYNSKFVGYKEKARLVFLFLCSTAMRIGDYNKLSDKNFESDKLLVYTTEKTNTDCFVPFIDDVYFRPRALYEEMGGFKKLSGQKLNEYIQEIFVDLGIHRVVPTSKFGRKTFATMAKIKGLSDTFIKLVTGHKSESSYKRYDGVDTRDLLKQFEEKARHLQAV
jgi:hypothetical protein